MGSIDIRNSSGSRMGYLDGKDIRDGSGSRLGYIDGKDIRDGSGTRLGTADGDEDTVKLVALLVFFFFKLL